MKVSTIGFAGKSAQTFFDLLRAAKVRIVLDVRLHNTSQLAGFAKKSDLPFFLGQLTHATYVEIPELAPEPEMLKRYRSKHLGWDEYAEIYCGMLASRAVEHTLNSSIFEHACLLCSEHEPGCCHRRLALDYLNRCWGNRLDITHLK